MTSLEAWLPPGSKHQPARHLIFRSFLLPVWTCFIPYRHKSWDGKGKLQYRRCGGTIVSGLLGNECTLPSDWDHHAAAARAASIRFRESHRPDPVLIDIYAECLLPTDDVRGNGNKSMASSPPCHYTLATKFIDDKLLDLAIRSEAIRQVVLLTDGFDTRPYRLKWPSKTVIFDISPESVFRVAHQRLKSVGAEVRRNCKYIHIPLCSCDSQVSLCQEGFDGGKPSVWAMQGLPLLTLADFGEILSVVSSLAMKGCTFVGELPGYLFDTKMENEISLKSWVHKIFMVNGFRVEIIDYNAVANIAHKNSSPGDYYNILFVAEQLKFSDKQLEDWRMAFLRMEEMGDEEGFEDLL